jgi:hypothetical protein
MHKLTTDNLNKYNLHYYDKKLLFKNSIIEHNNYFKNTPKTEINIYWKLSKYCNMSMIEAKEYIGTGLDIDKKQIEYLNRKMKIYRKPKYVKYVTFKQKYKGITLFIDKYLKYVDKVQSKIKIAHIWETRNASNKTHYNFIMNSINANKFDIILTYDIDILTKYPDKAYFFPNDAPSIGLESFKMHEKSKLCSFLCKDSGRPFYGHQLRPILKDIINVNNYNIDIYEKIANKSICFNDYKFTIVCLNSKYDYCLCCSILAPLCTGTIPVYYGTTNLKHFFDEKGFLYFSNGTEFIELYNNYINDAYYDNNIDAVKYNFEKVKQFMDPDDNILEIIRLYHKNS